MRGFLLSILALILSVSAKGFYFSHTPLLPLTTTSQSFSSIEPTDDCIPSDVLSTESSDGLNLTEKKSNIMQLETILTLVVSFVGGFSGSLVEAILGRKKEKKDIEREAYKRIKPIWDNCIRDIENDTNQLSHTIQFLKDSLSDTNIRAQTKIWDEVFKDHTTEIMLEGLDNVLINNNSVGTDITEIRKLAANYLNHEIELVNKIAFRRRINE